MADTSRLAGQVALVTGGGRGIGRAICQALDAAGARVIVHYGRNRAAAAATLATLTQPGAALLEADLRSTVAISSAVARLDANRVDMLVNNAGVWKPTPLGATDETTLDELLDVNLRAVFWFTQAMLPKFAPGARIVNISSTAGRVGIAGGRSAYGATKAAIDAFTRNWALELAGRGIRVNAVAPGYVETDMTTAHLGDPATRARALARHPLGRLGRVDDVARAVLFLCTEDSGFVTGQSINVSGGFVI
jgi:NAD(P)-dependent dehydrogenase (short-subunit alcohol dehydrogenase family)